MPAKLKNANLTTQNQASGKPKILKRANQNRRSPPPTQLVENIATSITGSISSTQTNIYDPVVGEYESTRFDVDLIGKGVCASYPITLAQVPFWNFFEGNSRNVSSTGILYDIQNSIQDETFREADRLVNEYYSINPDARSALASIRDKNLSLYNTVIQNIGEIKLSRDQLLEQTTRRTIVPESYNKIVRLTSTNGADDTRASNASNAVSNQNLLSAKPKNIKNTTVTQAFSASTSTRTTTTPSATPFTVPATQYSDDDLTTFEEFDILSPETLNRILPSSTHESQQSTKGYQSIRSTIADIYYGSKGSAGNNVDPLDIRALYLGLQIDSTEFYSVLDYVTAAVRAVQDVRSVAMFDNDEGTVEPEPLSISYAAREKKLYGYNEKFANSTSIVASQIVDDMLGFRLVASLNQSLSPTATTISILDTANNDVSFVYKDSLNRTILLEDISIGSTKYADCFDVFAAYELERQEINDVLDRLNNTKIGIESLSDLNKLLISNQISSFLLKTLMDEFSNFFDKSAWCGSSSDYSAARCAMFMGASENTSCYKRVYSIVNAKRESLANITDEEQMQGTVYSSTTKNRSLSGYWNVAKSGQATFDDVGKREFYAEDTTPTFANNLYGDSTGFALFDDIIEKVKRQFPNITDQTEDMIRLLSFNIFMYLNRLLKATTIFGIGQLTAGKNKNSATGEIRWSKSDAASIADICRAVMTATSVDDVNFTTFTRIKGSAPTENQKSKIGPAFFVPIRRFITQTLQKYENIRQVLSFFHSKVNLQQQAIDDIQASYDKILAAYSQYGSADPTQSTNNITRKYETSESIAELLQRDERYKAFLKNTRIRSIAGRSSNYRSIVKAAHRDKLPETSSTLVAIGIPYGFFENIRNSGTNNDLAPNYKFGSRIYAESINEGTQESIDITYTLYGSQYHNTLTVSVVDQVNSNRVVSNISDRSVEVNKLDISSAKLNKISQADDESEVEHQIIQAALQSYFEDLYGIYLRYACLKTEIDVNGFPEVDYSVAAVSNVRVEVNQTLVDTETSVEQQNALIRSRLQAAIMMHEDFSTTYMVRELESGMIFDKIHYALFENSQLPSEITQLTPSVTA